MPRPKGSLNKKTIEQNLLSPVQLINPVGIAAVELIVPGEIRKEEGEDEIIELTDKQWATAVKIWNNSPKNPPSLKQMVRLVFRDQTLSGQSKYGLAIKKRMHKEGMEYTIKVSPPTRKVELTTEQKEYVKNNHGNNTAVEMAQTMFNDANITGNHLEVRAIVGFIKEAELDKIKVPDNPNDDVPLSDYCAPADICRIATRINKWVKNVRFDKSKITKKQEKDFEKLKGYLDGYRFEHHINSYDKNSDRDLFESSFVRYTYDKPDLTEEEVDQYILLCGEVVMGTSIHKRAEKLRTHLDQKTNAEDPRIAMGLVEAINASEKEYHQCLLRQEKLLNALKVKRSEKDLKRKDATASILNLVELWRSEETRLQMLKMAEKRQKVVLDEFDRLDTLDELKCRILGINKEDIFS